MSDLNQSAVAGLKRWIVASDKADELRRQRNSELDPPEPDVGFMGDDPESAPSHLAFMAALREKRNATKSLRRIARQLVAESAEQAHQPGNADGNIEPR